MGVWCRIFIFSKIGFEHCLQAKGVSKDKVKYLRGKTIKNPMTRSHGRQEKWEADRRACLRQNV